MKRLLDKDKYYSFTAEGRELHDLVERKLDPLVKTVVTEEFDVVDAEHIFLSAVGIMFSELRLTWGIEHRKQAAAEAEAQRKNDLLS